MLLTSDSEPYCEGSLPVVPHTSRKWLVAFPPPAQQAPPVYSKADEATADAQVLLALASVWLYVPMLLFPTAFPRIAQRGAREGPTFTPNQGRGADTFPGLRVKTVLAVPPPWVV